MNTQWMTRIADKTGVIGTLIGSFSCAMCFPAAASIGAVIGLSFLSRWEGLFVHILIPVFASISLAANLIGWFSHHQWLRVLAGIIGPILVLIGSFGMTQHFLPIMMARELFYVGLVVMLLAALWDLFSPAHRRCNVSLPKEGQRGG